MFYLLLGTFVTAVVYHLVTRYSKRGSLLRQIPGPTAYPLVGNMLRFAFKSSNELWEAAREITKNYYPITRVWLSRTATIMVVHPDDLEIIFTSQKLIEKGYLYNYLHPWLERGLLTSTANKWRQRRKILTPAFHFSILLKYLEIITEEGRKILHNLHKEGNEIIKDLIPFCTQCTLNITCESTMGVALDKMDHNLVNQYEKAIRDMGYVVSYRTPKPYLLNWMVKFWWNIGKMQKNALETLHHFTNTVIKNRKEYHYRNNNKYLIEFMGNLNPTDESFEADGGKKKRLAMLDLMLAAEKSGLIDEKGIREEVDTFCFEAHDTTGMAMTYTLMLLAENKEAQDLARAEVNEIMKNNNEVLSSMNLQELNYLERCIKESLRLYPPVATIMRYAPEELQLKNALIPADSHIMIHLYDTHRDPNFWTEPEKFDPDRFLPDRSKNRHLFAYVPFSAGPRNCIGQKFAMMELKSLISRILYDFYLEPIDLTSDMKIAADIILRPMNPVRIKLVKIIK